MYLNKEEEAKAKAQRLKEKLAAEKAAFVAPVEGILSALEGFSFTNKAGEETVFRVERDAGFSRLFGFDVMMVKAADAADIFVEGPIFTVEKFREAATAEVAAGYHAQSKDPKYAAEIKHEGGGKVDPRSASYTTNAVCRVFETTASKISQVPVEKAASIASDLTSWLKDQAVKAGGKEAAAALEARLKRPKAAPESGATLAIA